MSQPGRGTGRLTSIGPYTLLDRVGSGGMGVVYRALDRRSGTVVAFKLLHDHVSADPAAVERFRREAHVASLLRSSYVVRTLEFGNDDGKYYLVSEYVEGRSLAEVLREGTPEPLAAIAIVSQAALALDEAFSREVTHRDIKPDNILVTEDGSVRLADFGIASLAYLGGLTQAGSYIGTVAYSSPEQHRGEADIRSDIYSLGVVLFEMLAGKRPFEAATATEMMRLHQEAELPLELLAAQPRALVEVVTRCLEKDPAKRYQRPSELLAALDHARPAVAGAVGDAWMEAAVASLAATGIHPAPAAAAAPESEAGPPVGSPVPPVPAATKVDAAPAATPAEPAATRIGGPPVAISGGGAPRIPRNLIIGAGAAGIALIGGLAAVFALAAGGDDDPPGGGPGGDATVTTAATPATSAPTTAQSPSTSPTAPGGETPGANKSPTASASGVATFAPASPTAGGGIATATAPLPTSTPLPPTPTTAPQPSYGSPTFATVLTQSGLPPAAGVPSGGTISGSCPTNLFAYVQHSNVPVGTQLTGSWQYQAQEQQNNPTFSTQNENDYTNYQFSNQQGLPAGTYTFRLRSGPTQVTSGTVTVAC